MRRLGVESSSHTAGLLHFAGFCNLVANERLDWGSMAATIGGDNQIDSIN
jgi:hypothetical protein